MIIILLFHYRDDFDPRITNEFSAAAFRIGHTMITDVIKVFNNTRNVEEEPINLSSAFGNPDIVREKMSDILRGLTIQRMEKIDNNFVDDIAEELFAEGLSLDLISLNIQRGRDHGLPGYVDYRELCLGGGKATSFDSLRSNINPAVN